MTSASNNLRALYAHPIDQSLLIQMRKTGRDVAGNAPVEWSTADGVPLRCCLRRARYNDEVVLISHAPIKAPSPWREVGPVFVHAGPCEGYDPARGLPPELRSGPRVLRSYRSDGSMNYDAITVVEEGADIESATREFLGRDDVFEVHLRSFAEQCFTYLVR